MSDQLLSLQEKSEKESYTPGKGKTKPGNMISRNLIILFISLVSLFSCHGKEEIPDSSDLIPRKDLIAILTEIHIADGLLPNRKIQNWILSVDSVSTYYYIIEKHGYKKETFDKTMHYYFVKKPKDLIRIYDGILGKLSEMESLLEKEVMISREHASNLWPGEKNYYFPETSDSDSVGFELSLSGSIIYTLKFTATIFPDDQSVNPKAIAYSVDADSLLTGKITHYQTLGFIKDGQAHTYTIKLKGNINKVIKVKGNLYDSDNCIEGWQKHVSFENIALINPSAEI